MTLSVCTDRVTVGQSLTRSPTSSIAPAIKTSFQMIPALVSWTKKINPFALKSGNCDIDIDLNLFHVHRQHLAVDFVQ